MEFTHFSLDKYPFIKQKILYWANLFPTFIVYDSNSHFDSYSKYDFLIGIDALSRYTEAFDNKNFKAWSNNDFVCGAIQYEFNHSLFGIVEKKNTFIDWENYYFFKPRYVIYIQSGRIHINRNYPEAIEILEKINQFEISAVDSLPKIQFETDLSKNEYIETVSKIKDKIIEGAFYELNYCIDFKAEDATFDPIQTFIHLNNIAQTPMTALAKLDKKWIFSYSPERLIAKRKNQLIAQPIKGTAKRNFNTDEDKRIKKELQTSEKERAENSMIVDLMRNDLTPFAKTGSIEVKEWCEIYSFKHVHQMISTIEATLENEEQSVDALVNCIPAGSMTGAPKKNVMKYIESFESFKRQMYAGNIGYIDFDGDFDWNVVIRSIYYDEKNKKANFSVGSAITIQSNAEEEYKECLLKAQFILKAFGNE